MKARQLPRITSVRNPRVVAARKLHHRKYRRREGRFLVEGLQLLHMALEAGARPLDVFYCEDYFAGPEAPRLLERFGAAGATLIPVAPHVLESLSERDVPQGLIATFALFEHHLADIPPRGTDLYLVVDRLQDPGNLGTLIRTADAVAARGILLVEPCVDPFDPKTVRGTMGSIFHVPLVRIRDVPQLFQWFAEQHIRPLGADAHQGVLWGNGLWEGNIALILGNEARGLSTDVRAHVSTFVRLPIVGQAESLNVAVAGGVFMYLWLKARSSSQDGQEGTGTAQACEE